ncbi:MAG: helix-turn-helix domain-containing protein [Candidatus Acidiferrales bacterium]
MTSTCVCGHARSRHGYSGICLVDGCHCQHHHGHDLERHAGVRVDSHAISQRAWVDTQAETNLAHTLIASTERVFGIAAKRLYGRQRSHRVADARFAAMYLCRTLTKLTWEELGEVFRRDHTSVIHGARCAKVRMSRDLAYRAKVDEAAALGNAEVRDDTRRDSIATH